MTLMPSTNDTVMQELNKFHPKTEILKEGIPVEKGVVLDEDWVERHNDLVEYYCQQFILYPDIFLDLSAAKDGAIELYHYQRMFLRACMRYRYVFGTYTRGGGKSFLAILSQILSCVFLPNSNRFLVSQYKKASLDIAKQKINEYFRYWPLLRNEIEDLKQSTDYIEMKFKNGSVFRVLTLSASSRGQRATGGILEEAALIDSTMLNEVILPMMNVPRRCLDGKVNPEEPHQQQVWITSAGNKTSFAYEKLIELLVNEVIDPEDYFICGSSYELPVYYGVLDKKFLNEQKMSSTLDMDGFARESLSIWTGNSSESWFNANKLIRARKLLKAERKYTPSSNKKMFYELAVDVARTGNNDTAVMVIKVLPHDQDAWTKKVVYTENLHKMPFPQQAARIKELNELFNPRDIIIDANTIGTGLLDELVIPSIGPKGQRYDALYVSNDPEHYPHPRGVEAKIYCIVANAALNNDIYSNFYIQISSGNVHLLANERIAREKLLTTKKGQQMNLYQREKFLLPYIMTSRLIDEINNLKLRPTGAANQLAVEQISKRINKDRVSALAYGLYRIKEYEDKETHRKQRRSGIGAMTFFSSKKNKAGD